MKKYSRHGLTGRREYNVWRMMIQRCTNPNSSRWKYYGARGITVCNRWMSFDNFWNDMRDTYKSDLTLERIDNNKGYYKRNCRWATRKEQARNTRNNRLIKTTLGITTLAEAAELSGIRHVTIATRIKLGWPTSELLSPPDYKRKKLYGTHRYG